MPSEQNNNANFANMSLSEKISRTSGLLKTFTQISGENFAARKSHMKDGDEATLDIPLELTRHLPGFVLDSGGSVIKVIYRSNEDFSGGKPIKEGEKGRLKLRCFDMGCHDEMINFLKDNCDVACDAQKQSTFFITGITTQHFKKKLEEIFNVKTKIFSEMDALKICIKNSVMLCIGCYKPSYSNFYKGKEEMQMIDSRKIWMERQRGNAAESSGNKLTEANPGIHENPQKKSSASNKSPTIAESAGRSDIYVFNSSNPLRDGPSPSGDLLSCGDPKEWIERHMSHNGFLEAPALLVMAGSTTVVYTVDSDYEIEFKDFIRIGGKTLCGLAEEMINVSDFDDLMALASKGSSLKVNTVIKDLGSESYDGDDYYVHFIRHQENSTAYSMGRLSSSNPNGKGSYAKEDVAAGLLEMVASAISKLAFLRAKLHRMERVYVCGSLARYEVARSAIEGEFMASSIVSDFMGELFPRMFCVENPGFLCALGLWCKNVKDAKSG